ncbi:MAG TPA: hypothetical protein VLE99_06775 [Candidatus Saccharimonadales bacterium]|nr:hypothetical protein [Candidatus Saccharimonadales bacterium]
MKQKDIALIIVIAFISAVVSFLVSNKLFVTPSNREQRVEVVDPINSTFVTPDSKYFNSSSIDPTLNTQIGGSTNQNPFNGSGQ